MKLKLIEDGKLAQGEFDPAPFGGKVLYRTLKDAVVMYHANLRQGTAKTKGRSEIAYSRKKPWKQKHTGRARAGDKKSPLWRGGGTIFGPHPRDFGYHMPKQGRRVALRSALAGKLNDGEVVLFASAGLSAPSAKRARAILTQSGAFERPKGAQKGILIVLAQPNPVVWKSFRNFPRTCVRTAGELCARDVAQAGLVLAETGALDALARRVGVSAQV
jgi:large subunit ribosomal protein L4